MPRFFFVHFSVNFFPEGEMGSGKSSLVLRYVKGQFFDYQVDRRDEDGVGLNTVREGEDEPSCS